MLKDILWRELNADDSIPVSASRHTLVHRNLDVSSLEFDTEEELPGNIDELEETDSEEDYDDGEDF